MATRARRSADLALVYALTEGNRCWCRARGDGSASLRGGASVRMRALWRFRGGYHGSTSRSRQARTWRHVRGATFRAAKIENPVNPSAHVIGNVQRTVGSHGQSRWTMLGLSRGLHCSGKTIRKYFALAGCALSGKWLINHVVTALRVWRPIPGTVERDEDAVMIMCWICRNGGYLVRAYADRLAAVAGIFRSQNQLLHEGVVVAFGPAVISLRFQKQ